MRKKGKNQYVVKYKGYKDEDTLPGTPFSAGEQAALVSPVTGNETQIEVCYRTSHTTGHPTTLSQRS